MADGIPAKPVGENPKWFFMRRVWDYVFGGDFPLKSRSPNLKIEFSDGAYFFTTSPTSRPGTSTPQTVTINRGLYDAGATYQHDQFVEYTPAGGQAGQYWCLEDGTTGVSPDTGAPSWTQTKYPSPGVWGA